MISKEGIPKMIEAYSGGELCEPMIVCRKNFESVFSPERLEQMRKIEERKAKS